MIELMEHNKKTYSNLIENLKRNEKVALIQATGCGKSYIIAKLIEEFYESKNVLIIIPTLTIMENWRGIVSEIKSNIDYVTYMDFGKDKEHEFDKYDLIIADEMHHLGSEVWGAKFKSLFMENKHNAKIIGLTATPIRYLDNCREMDIELFNGNTVRGITLSDAISQGVLPRFEYVLAMYGNEGEYDEYAEKSILIKDVSTRNALLRRLELVRENQISIRDILHKHMPNNKRKIIAFINEISETQEMIDTLREAFPKANFHFANSKLNNKENICAIKEFKEDDSNISIMITVDMFNEGVHISGVNTVIMFRKTVSPAIYFQQLGRGLSSSNCNDVFIFDFASNCNNIKSICKSNEECGFIERYNNSENCKDKQIIINDYSIECISVFKKIEELLRENIWTKEDDDFLINNAGRMDYKKISYYLEKSLGAISVRARKLGISKSKKWTKEEDDFIKNNYGKISYSEMSIVLDGRTNQSISARGGYLIKHGLINKMSRTEQFDLLQRHYESIKK